MIGDLNVNVRIGCYVEEVVQSRSNASVERTRNELMCEAVKAVESRWSDAFFFKLRFVWWLCKVN